MRLDRLTGVLMIVAVAAFWFGCAPKNGAPRTPGDWEVAIRRAADADAGSTGMIIDNMAESLAAWRAGCVADTAGRSGRVVVTSEVEKGEYAPVLAEMILPYAAEFKFAEARLLAAAGLTPAADNAGNAVIIEIVLQTNCRSGCRVEAGIRSDKLPEWHRTWNLVLTGELPHGMKK